MYPCNEIFRMRGLPLCRCVWVYVNVSYTLKELFHWFFRFFDQVVELAWCQLFLNVHTWKKYKPLFFFVCGLQGFGAPFGVAAWQSNLHGKLSIFRNWAAAVAVIDFMQFLRSLLLTCHLFTCTKIFNTLLPCLWNFSLQQIFFTSAGLLDYRKHNTANIWTEFTNLSACLQFYLHYIIGCSTQHDSSATQFCGFMVPFCLLC